MAKGKKRTPWAIWWVNPGVYDALPELPDEAPRYLKKEYASRKGRAGRCRLWSAAQFEDRGISPWPDTPLTKWLETDDYGGIVISDDSFEFNVIPELPGLITNFSLERLV
jgi:hypothetical protein